MGDITLPEAVAAFVAATNAHDPQAWDSVFADGATVRDDGTTYVGEAEIGPWIRSHLIDPAIVLTPLAFEGDRLVASGDGDFPGGPLSFSFVFGVESDRVTSLVIEPV